jgi:regulator of sigma E protease
VSFFIAVLGLAFLILIHELGHFLTARAVGMRPRRFYVGFPPAIVKTTRNGIEYGLGAIPLGGYVKIPGMHRPAPADVDVHFGAAVYEAPGLVGPIERVKRPLDEGDLETARRVLPELQEAVAAARLSSGAARAAERGLAEIDDALSPQAYWRQRTWKRLAVIGAGPGTNLVFAVVLIAVFYMLGTPVDASRRVASIEPKTPAAAAGLRPGDTIVAINGQVTNTFKEVRRRITQSGGKPLVVSVFRGPRVVTLKPVHPKKIEGYYALGFHPAGIRYKHYGPIRALRLAAQDTWDATKRLGGFFGHITRKSSRKEISGPVGIVNASSQAVQSGHHEYLLILALISLSLGLLNLLPLLPLDGGHIAFSIVEGIRGKAVGRIVYERVSAVGIALILVLYVIGISNDVGRLGGG